MDMTGFSKKLMFAELFLGVLFLIYELWTGQPWAMDGVPWTMEENFHFTVALGFFVAAGFTFIFGAVSGSIGRRDSSKE